MGDITIWLPSEVSVRVDVDDGIIDIDTSGLDHRGRSYFNAVYGESDSEIIIRIDAGVGKINLIVAE